MAKIKAPNSEFNGRIGDVIFHDGVAETNDIAVIMYCRGAGYEVDGQTDNPDAVPPQLVDSREVDTQVVGTPLRDAAVDPQPGDFMVPTNAGQADPHGPDVAAPGVHAAPPAPIVPGLVHDDPQVQEAREADAANRVLVGDEPVQEATAALADTSTGAEPPKGNASQETWARWVVANVDGVDPEQVAGMGRDELRDTYGPKAE